LSPLSTRPSLFDTTVPLFLLLPLLCLSIDRSYVYREQWEFFTGIDLEDYADLSVDDLLDAVRMGEYGRVIDLLDHPLRPIGPNDNNMVRVCVCQ
jgi:hypothetical protein